MGADHPDDGPAPGDEPSVRPRWLLPAALALLAAAVAVAAVVVGSGGDEGPSVEDVAVTFAERLLTFAPDDAGASIDSVLELSAGEFAENYRAAADAGLAEVLERAGTESSATAGTVFVGPADGGATSVVVEVDVVRRTSSVPEVAFTTFLVLDLVDDDGWAVVDVTPLEESGRPPVPAEETEATTTTTTAPGG